MFLVILWVECSTSCEMSETSHTSCVQNLYNLGSSLRWPGSAKTRLSKTLQSTCWTNALFPLLYFLQENTAFILRRRVPVSSSKSNMGLRCLCMLGAPQTTYLKNTWFSCVNAPCFTSLGGGDCSSQHSRCAAKKVGAPRDALRST